MFLGFQFLSPSISEYDVDATTRPKRTYHANEIRVGQPVHDHMPYATRKGSEKNYSDFYLESGSLHQTSSSVQDIPVVFMTTDIDCAYSSRIASQLCLTRFRIIVPVDVIWHSHAESWSETAGAKPFDWANVYYSRYSIALNSSKLIGLPENGITSATWG